MSTPEFEIFKRVEELEDIALNLMEKTSNVEPSIKSLDKEHQETRKLVLATLLITYIDYATRNPTRCRAWKDKIMDMLNHIELDTHIKEIVEQAILIICNSAEEQYGKMKVRRS